MKYKGYIGKILSVDPAQVGQPFRDYHTDKMVPHML